MASDAVVPSDEEIALEEISLVPSSSSSSDTSLSPSKISLAIVIGPVGCGKSSVGALLTTCGYEVIEVDNVPGRGNEKNRRVQEMAKAAAKAGKIPAILNGGGIFTSTLLRSDFFTKESFLAPFQVVRIFAPIELDEFVRASISAEMTTSAASKRRRKGGRRKKASSPPEEEKEIPSEVSFEEFAEYWNSDLRMEREKIREKSPTILALQTRFIQRSRNACEYRLRTGVYRIGSSEQMGVFPSTSRMNDIMRGVTIQNFSFQFALLEWGKNIPITTFAYNDSSHVVSMASSFPRGELTSA